MLPRSAVAGALLACLSTLSGSACSQLRTDPATWGAGQDGIRLHSSEVVDLHTTAPRPIDPYAYKRGLFSSLGLYEYKPAGIVLGQYTRAHYAFGLHSALMRDALSLNGLEADSCVAPMVRLRARQTTVTGAGGVSMSLLARCTFY